MQRVALLLGAFMLWLLAIVGAIAVSVWLRLSAPDARLLVIAVAFIAFFGAFLPIFRSGTNRKS